VAILRISPTDCRFQSIIVSANSFDRFIHRPIEACMAG
jgi:hypothetical protein